MSRPPRAAVRPLAPELREISNGPPCPQAEAILEHAAAIDRLNERFGPAADTVAGLGDRLDAFCKWIKGKWPWVVIALFLVLQRTVNMTPEDVPNLIKALSDLAKAFS